MKSSTKAVIVTLAVAALGFLTEPNGPLGSFWRPVASFPKPEGVQLLLFMILGAVEALALGLGVSFLLFGGATMRASSTVTKSMVNATRLAIAWLLVNWWAHDSLHQHVGMNLNGLLGIEYAFHFTLILSAIVVARYFLAMAGAPSAATA